MATSIIQDIDPDFTECFLCGAKGTQLHHCLHGTANRKQADKFKLTVMLCQPCHMKLHDKGVGDIFLQRTAQKAFEAKCGSRLEFINIFGKSYL